MSSSKDTRPAESVQDGDATGAFSSVADLNDHQVEAPATGYVYVSDGASADEIDEALAAESLTKQLLRNGDSFEKKTREEKREERKAKAAALVPGTAVGGLKGSRADDAVAAGGKPVLPSSSRTSEIDRDYKKQNKQKQQKKSILPVVALSGGVLALAAGGVAYAMLAPTSRDTTSQVEPIASPTASATPSATPTAAPSPSINNRVPEVKYVDPTDTALDQGSVEYLDETQVTEEPTPEQTVVEEIVPTEAPVEEIPTEEATIEQAPVEEPLVPETQEPVETTAPSTDSGVYATEPATVNQPTNATVPTSNTGVGSDTGLPAETTVPTAGSDATTGGASTQGESETGALTGNNPESTAGSTTNPGQ